MLDLTDEFFQTAELLGQHSKEVLKLNGPFFSVTIPMRKGQNALEFIFKH